MWFKTVQQGGQKQDQDKEINSVPPKKEKHVQNVIEYKFQNNLEKMYIMSNNIPNKKSTRPLWENYETLPKGTKVVLNE